MNKNLLSLLLLLTFTLPLSAQWTWQNPLPPGNGFQDVQFIDSLNGWACGNSIIKTTDGGKNWILLKSPSQDMLLKLFFINKNKGFLHSYGNDCRTFVTNDGGNSWEAVTPLDNKYLPRMQFLNEKVGYVLQFWETGGTFDQHIFKTTDGGLTWNNYDPLPSNLKSYSFFFLDENYGWVGTDGGIARTTDAGKTWQSSFIPGYADPPSVEHIQFINKKQGFAVANPSVTNSITNRNCFAFTTDGGATWSTRDMPDGYADLNDVHFVSEKTGYVAENKYPHGRIFYTTDLGSTWRTLETTARKFAFIDSLRAWGLNYYNLVSTTDGWMTSHSQPEPATQLTLNSVSALDSVNIAAAGIFSTVVLSSDGGKTWELSNFSLKDSVSIQSVFYRNADEIWAVGSRSAVLWSTDKGKSWNKTRLDTLDHWFCDIAFLDDTTGFIIKDGPTSALYVGKAAPGGSGLVWQKTREFPFEIFKIKFTKKGTGYIAGFNKMLKSTDRGQTWKELQLPAKTAFVVLDAIDNYVWTVAGNNILISQDEGNTWNSYKAFDYPEPVHVSLYVYAMSFADTLNGAMGFTSKIIRTTDGGKTWKEDNQITPNYFNSLDFADKDHAWAVGKGGMILNYNAQLTEVEDMTRLKLSSYYLDQNYPNPFNPQTTIRYSITRAGVVSLKIYDMLGNEIAALINEEKSPGTYNISFDANKYRLSSGVYIYRLQVNDFTESKKLLFLK